MEVTSVALFISISLVVFGISYYYFTTRHRERMALIEKDLAPDYFKDTLRFLPFVLILGIVSIGIALGVLTAAYLKSLQIEGLNDFLLPASIFLFLGISLLVSYFVLLQMQKKQKR